LAEHINHVDCDELRKRAFRNFTQHALAVSTDTQIPSVAEEALLVMSKRGRNDFGNWPSS
jgi:hypothetical protein